MKVLENKFINRDFRELKQLYRVWKSREFAGTAKIVREYEQKLENNFNSQHAVAVSNGTDALEIILRSYKISVGDEVILPAYSPVMSVLPIVSVGANPVFVDTVSQSSFNLDVKDLEAKITKKTKAVLVVPMWGYPIEMKVLKRICKIRDIWLIEDVSHCHGSKIYGKYLGTLADVGYFSTQERKLISTGEGGFILTDNSNLDQELRSIRDFGKVMPGSKENQEHANEYGYKFGLNYRITAASAALGIAQIDKLSSKIAKRTYNASRLLKHIEPLGFKEILNISDTVNNYYSICIISPKPTKQLGEHLLKDGIVSDTTRFKIRPLYEMPIFKQYKSSCPNTGELLRHIITIPCHEGLSRREIRYIIDKFRKD